MLTLFLNLSNQITYPHGPLQAAIVLFSACSLSHDVRGNVVLPHLPFWFCPPLHPRALSPPLHYVIPTPWPFLFTLNLRFFDQPPISAPKIRYTAYVLNREVRLRQGFRLSSPISGPFSGLIGFAASVYPGFFAPC